MSLDVTAELRRLRDWMRDQAQTCREYLRNLEAWQRAHPAPWVPGRMRDVRAARKRYRAWGRALTAALATDRCPSTP